MQCRHVSGAFWAMLTAALACGAPCSAVAQTGGIKGHVLDSAEGKAARDVLVKVLLADTTTVASARTGREGLFWIKGLAPGQYRLGAGGFGLQTSYKFVTVRGGEVTDAGTFLLAPRADTLSAVIVRPKEPAVRMQGDTLEYSTSGAALRPNATVEELLQRLPGIQVQADGTVYVNGRKVERLLVDGEDIFGRGTDMKNITRNFNGDLFSKVQVLDKKSDQAAFTGMDDGKTTLTLNVVVKRERKQGYFGKAEAGAGSGGYYENTGLVGAFREGRQFAALGMASNTGATGFAGGLADGGAAGLSISGSANDGLAASAGTGVPAAAGGGLHYAGREEKTGEHVTGDYGYGHMSTRPYTLSAIEQLLPDTVFVLHQSARSNNVSDEHHFSGSYEGKAGGLSSLRLDGQARSVVSVNQLAGHDSTLINDKPVNRSDRRVSSSVSNKSLGGTLYWNRQLGKAAHLAITGGIATASNRSSGYLYAVSSFATALPDTTDQKKTADASGTVLETTANYVTALSKVVTFGAGYGGRVEAARAVIDTYNKEESGYTSPVDSLSSHYKSTTTNHRETLNITVKNKRLLLITGVDVLQAVLSAKGSGHGGPSYGYHFASPRVSGHYAFDENHILYFNYNAAQVLPTLNQLQSVENNNDPLHVIVGNSSLKPASSYNISARYFIARPSLVNIGARGTVQENAFATRTSTDTLGRQTTQVVNVPGNRNINAYLSISRKMGAEGPQLGADVNGAWDRQNTYTGDMLALNNSYHAGGRLGLVKAVPDRYRVEANAAASYVLLKSSVSGGNAQYWTQWYSLLLELRLPGGLLFNNSLRLTVLQKTRAFTGDNSLLVWDCFLHKDLMEGKLSVRLCVKDLLRQNTGISRTVEGNQASEINTNNVAGRYALLTAAYHFVHKTHYKTSP